MNRLDWSFEIGFFIFGIASVLISAICLDTLSFLIAAMMFLMIKSRDLLQ